MGLLGEYTKVPPPCVLCALCSVCCALSQPVLPPPSPLYAAPLCRPYTLFLPAGRAALWVPPLRGQGPFPPPIIPSWGQDQVGP